MKKYLSLIAIFAVAAVACNKVDESQVLEPENEAVAGTNLVSFSVNLPDFVNADTKVSISDAGAFSWEEYDAIFVLCCKEDDNTFHQVPFTYNTANGNFECSFPAEVTYPGGTGLITISGITRVATPEEANADGRPLAVYPDPLSVENEYRYTDAQKFIKMEGSLNSTTGAIDFVHKSALVNIHIANVPSFASYFTVSGGTAPVKVNFNGGTPAEANTTVPITPTGSASDIIITLYDSADNVIISKKKTGKTLEAGNLYDTPQIAVGPVVLIKNDVYNEMHNLAGKDWDTVNNTESKICFYSSYGETEYCSWSASTTNLNAITIGGIDYEYFVYPASASGKNVRVEIFNKDGEYGYPRTVRNITLSDGVENYTVGYGLGLRKTNETFCYAFYEGGDSADKSINIYAFDPEAFGSWQESRYATGTSTMWKNGRVIRYYLTNGFASTSKFIIRQNDTETKLINDDLPKTNDSSSLNFIDGNCAIGFWKDGDNYWWYSPSSINEYLQKGPWM